MTDEPAREQLEMLLRLQEAEATVRRLEHRLAHLSEQQLLDDATERDAELADAEAALRVDLDPVGSAVKRLEGEIDLLTQRRDAEQQRLYSGEVASPRELQAIRAEVTSIERRISGVEDQLLAAMEQREKLDARVNELAGYREELAREVERMTASRDDAAKELLAELGEAQVSRAAQREHLSEQLLEQYAAAAERFGATAVAELRGDLCTGCRIDLPRIEVSELRTGPPLTTCPECDRLLVVLG